jgi:hypothetical protein
MGRLMRSSNDSGQVTSAEYPPEASNYSADVIACARDICTYFFQTHGRFPAHCDTIHVPGVWLQAHHVEEGYYQEARCSSWERRSWNMDRNKIKTSGRSSGRPCSRVPFLSLWVPVSARVCPG